MRLRDRLARAHADGMAREAHSPVKDAYGWPVHDARKQAAVLMAVTDGPRPSLILTERPKTMPSHPGQVAFPGGRIDPTDVDALDAALREAEEEVGLPRHLVDVLGEMDMFHTGSGYDITPILGVVPHDPPLVRNEYEVDEIFTAPLDFVLDPANHTRHTVEWSGAPRSYYEMYWEGHRIWGVTAGIIVNLARRLQWIG